MLGLKRGYVKLNEYDKNWRKNADEVRKSLKKILGVSAIDIQHVGSTSIKYLKAKPIIDIMVAVINFDEILKFIPELKTKGFFYISGWDRFNEKLCVSGDLDKNNENLKIKLSDLYPNNRDLYTAGKEDFIKNILKEAKEWKILGKVVTVTVDRPLGSKHPRYPDIVFPINYGYVKDIKAKDNELQDAYVIGTKKPINRFTGKIIAIIKRENDIDEKWVVAPISKKFYKPQIMEYLNFQEKYSESDFVCLYEKSCGAVVYTIKNNQIFYLLIKNRSKNVGFPKGHIEIGETEEKTALREINEETGLTVKLDKKFKEFYAYTINFYIRKQVVYFLARFNSDKINIPKNEILSYHITTYKDAMHMLNYENERKILRNANNYLKNIKINKPEDI
ncbi:MAG: Inorganic pyrophosphatase [Clostridia bacterium]|nr:Inorganic pyrophosphatase [Clostridia bacterium]